MSRTDGRGEWGSRIPRRLPGLKELPLSAAQQQLWFADQRMPGSPANNCWTAVRLRGPLDLGALRASLRDIVARHEVLRTRFDIRDDRPFQTVMSASDTELELDLVDLAGLPAAVAERGLADTVSEAGAAPFDLGTPPLLRAQLIRLAEQDHALVVAVHHMATDGWSLRVIFDELSYLYSAHRRGRPGGLPALTAQYADFSIWQRRRGADATAQERERTYWLAKLAGLTALELPTDRRHPDVAGSQTSTTRFQLSADEVAALTELGRAGRATLYMTTLSVFLALLGRYTGRHDVAVSTLVSGRPSVQLSGVIGFFVNTVILRADLESDPTFRELLRRVRDTTLEALANADLAFAEVLDELRPPREPGRIPLAPVAFLSDSTPEGGPDLDGLAVEQIGRQFSGVTFDLMLAVQVVDGELHGTVRYRSELFDADTIARLVRHYQMLLSVAAHRPDTPISLPSLLSARERHQLLAEANDTTQPFAREALHELFERRAATHPDAPAVRCAGREISYGVLDRAANRLADALRARGVQRADRVGLALDATPELLVALLAVFKAGAAGVALRPGGRTETAEFVIGENRISLVLTADPGPIRGVASMDVDLDALTAAAQPVVPQRVPVDPGTDVALVFYVADGVGAPSAVELTHSGLVNGCTHFSREHRIGPGDSVLNLCPPRFDGSVYETLGMLISGGCVVQAEPALAAEPAYWTRLLREHGITVWHSTPSQAERLIEALAQESGTLDSLRVAFLAGRRTQATIAERLRAAAPSVCVVTATGATEASICSTSHRVGRIDPYREYLPVGRAIANQKAYILDDSMRPVPIGVPGILHFGGMGVVAGYRDRPTLSATKFPVWQGNRLYRTDTVARWLLDGTIEPLAEQAAPVVVHGESVLMAEIEAALRADEQIADAAVSVRRDASGVQVLFGYLVAGPTGAMDLTAVRRHLSDLLPSTMVPDLLLMVAEILRRPDGQVDWMELPEVPLAG